MREVKVIDGKFVGYTPKRILKWLKSPSQTLDQSQSPFVLRKRGVNFVFAYVANNRRVQPHRYRTSELEAELSIHVLLETM